MDIARLRILVDIDSTGVARGAAASTAAITGFERSAVQSLSRVTTAFSRLTPATKGVLALGGAAVLVGTALAATVGPAIEFESAFAGVEKTVDGTTEQLAGIREGLLDLSTQIPTSAADLAGIAENAGQLGIAAADVVEFTRVIALLGETTDLDFSQAAQSVARFINVTGDALSVEDLANVIVELGNNTATTESQIVNFASRLGASLGAVGASQDEILALAATFSSLDIRAEAGGTAVSRVFREISDAAKLGGTELEVFAQTAGLTTEAFRELALENPTEAFRLFALGLREIDAEGRSITPTLEALDLSGERITRTLLLAAQGADQLDTNLALAAGQAQNGTAAFDEANKRFETTAARLEILQNRLQRLAIELGTPALGVFALGADSAGDAIERLADLIRPLAVELGTTFENVAIAARRFYDVLGEPALQLTAAGIAGLIEVVTGLLAAFNELGPVGPVILVGIIVALRQLQAQLLTTTAATASTTAAVVSVGTAGATSTASIGALAVAVGNLVALLSALAAASTVTTTTTTTTTAAMAGLALAANSAAAGVTNLGVSTVGFNNALIALGPTSAATAGTLTATTGATAALTAGTTAATASTGRLAGASAIATGTLRTLGGAAIGASRSMLAFAASSGPLIAVAAVLVAVGKATQDAAAAAREAEGDFRDMINNGFESGNIAQVERQLASTKTRIEELQGLDRVPEGLSTSFDGWGQSIKSVGQILTPFTENTIVNARAEAEALQVAIDDIGLDGFREKLDNAAAAAGISSQAAFELGVELGVLDDLLTGGGVGLRTFVLAIEEATAEQQALADETGILFDLIRSGTATQLDYADSLGITTAELNTLANQLDDVSIDDLLDPDKASAAFAEIKLLLNEYRDLADAIGVTTVEFIEQIDAVDDLTASHSALRSAVSEANDALALIGEQQRLTNEATLAFEEALDGIGNVDGLETAAAALRTLTLEYAASGVSASEAAAKQEELFAAFLNAAAGAGIAEDQAIAVAIALGLVPEAVLAEITVEGEAALAEATRVEDSLNLLAREYIASLELDADGAFITRDDLFEQLIDLTETEFIAVLEANGINALEVTALVKEAADLYRDTEYLAFLEANGIDAEEVIGISQEAALAYAAGDYTAFIKAIDDGATDTISGIRTSALNLIGYAAADAGSLGLDPAGGDPYTVVLSAQDEATEVINGAVDALRDFRSKTVTITTVHRTIGTNSAGGISGGSQRSTGSFNPTSSGGGGGASTFFADGGITTVNPPLRAYAEGGIGQSSARRPPVGTYDAGGLADVLSAGHRASPAHSDIYTPAFPYRIFAEPQVGKWEAFIAESAPIDRNRAIVSEVAHRLGMFRQGGIADLVHRYQGGGVTNTTSSVSSLSLTANITIDGSAVPAGTDVDGLIAIVDDRVNDALAQTAGRLGNARIG